MGFNVSGWAATRREDIRDLAASQNFLHIGVYMNFSSNQGQLAEALKDVSCHAGNKFSRGVSLLCFKN